MTGNSTTTFDGIMFAPNAELDLTGNTGSNALGSQMFVNNASLTGNSTLDDEAPRRSHASSSAARTSRLIR